MKFENIPQKWNNVGVKPTEILENEGFKAGYKPPAAYFNYIFNNYSKCIQEIQEKLGEDTSDIKYTGGEKLSPDATAKDPDAQYDVIEKSSDEIGQIFTVNTSLQKGLYSVAIRLKVSDVSSGENILKLDITDGDKVISKYIKPQMLKIANKYTTIGCAAECTSGTLGITLSIDKVWTGQTVRVDYVTIAPAMVSISSL